MVVRGQHLENIMVDAKTMKVWVIDGYGTGEFIRLPQYFRWFGARRLRKSFGKFFSRYGGELCSLAEKHGFWVESRFVKRPEKFAGGGS